MQGFYWDQTCTDQLGVEREFLLKGVSVHRHSDGEGGAIGCTE